MPAPIAIQANVAGRRIPRPPSRSSRQHRHGVLGCTPHHTWSDDSVCTAGGFVDLSRAPRQPITSANGSPIRHTERHSWFTEIDSSDDRVHGIAPDPGRGTAHPFAHWPSSPEATERRFVYTRSG